MVAKNAIYSLYNTTCNIKVNKNLTNKLQMVRLSHSTFKHEGKERYGKKNRTSLYEIMSSVND